MKFSIFFFYLKKKKKKFNFVVHVKKIKERK